MYYCSIGGNIIDMAWDSSGKVLAVIFKDSNLIPVFSTTICSRPKVLQLTPRCVFMSCDYILLVFDTYYICYMKIWFYCRCLIRGRLNEIPNCLDFQKNVKFGTNLTIVSLFEYNQVLFYF